jgi:hypothetical protein
MTQNNLNNLMIQVRLSKKDIWVFYDDENSRQWISLLIGDFNLSLKEDGKTVINVLLKEPGQYEYVADKEHYGISQPNFNVQQFIIDYFPIDTQKHFWYYWSSQIWYHHKIKQIEDLKTNNPHNSPAYCIDALEYVLNSGLYNSKLKLGGKYFEKSRDITGKLIWRN